MRGAWLIASVVLAGCGGKVGDGLGQGGIGDPTGMNPSVSTPDASTGVGVSSPGTVDAAPIAPWGSCENPYRAQGGASTSVTIDPSLPEMTAPAPFEDVTGPTAILLWTPEDGSQVSQVWVEWSARMYTTGIIYSGACGAPDALSFSDTFGGWEWGGLSNDTPFEAPIYFAFVHDGDHWPIGPASPGGVNIGFHSADAPPPPH